MDDSDLLSRYRQTEDASYLGALYDRYLHLVYGLCLKYLHSREDSQDATMAIYEKIAKTLLDAEVAHFKSWLYVVSKNHCLMQLRKAKTEKEKNNVLFMESPDIAHLNDEDVDGDLDALTPCLEELKEQQKLCVSLFYLQKQSYQEIAQQTALEVKTVKSAIQNGKRNLKNCIEQQREARQE